MQQDTQWRHISLAQTDRAFKEFERVRPENARIVVTNAQKIWLWLIAGLAVVLTFSNVTILITLCVVGFCTLFLLKSYLNLGAANTLIQIDQDMLDAVSDDDLPFIEAKIPMFHEPSEVKDSVRWFEQMDYPTDKFRVTYELEEADTETIREFQRIHLPGNFRVNVLAKGRKNGNKPGALLCDVLIPWVAVKNQNREDDMTVVFDAEDRPELNQPKKAALAFLAAKTLGIDVWCIQAKLAFHNITQNWLTRMGGAEYIGFFNFFLALLGHLGLFVPLGGTSNYFLTKKLQQIGSWDPYNVTEDFDLGTWIKRKGGQVQVIDSVTWEEANPRLFGKGAWISQRSRWIKGHMQTWLVHMRNPWQLLRELGVINFILFQLIALGTPLSLLLGPIFLALTGIYFLSRTLISAAWPEGALVLQLGIEALFPSAVYYMAVASFIVGNIGLLYYLMIGCLLRKEYSTVKYMLSAPIYWLLMSLAAWKALRQMVTKPHYWEKTSHGHSKPKG